MISSCQDFVLNEVGMVASQPNCSPILRNKVGVFYSRHGFVIGICDDRQSSHQRWPSRKVRPKILDLPMNRVMSCWSFCPSRQPMYIDIIDYWFLDNLCTVTIVRGTVVSSDNNLTLCSNFFFLEWQLFILDYHQDVLTVQIPWIISRHAFLSAIALGRSSRQHPGFTQSWCI